MFNTFKNRFTERGSAVLLIACVLPVFFAANAHAQFGGPLDRYGARAGASVANCPSFCTSFNFAPLDGGVGSTSGETSVSESRGNAASFAALDASLGLSIPLLRAQSYVLNSGSGAFGTAFAVEGYTYTGPGTQTFDLDIVLDGEIYDPTPADGDTSIVGTVYVFEQFGFDFISDLGTLLFESGATAIADTTLSLAATGSTTGSVSFDLSTGESVYLWTLLDVDAERDMSFADAFSTMTMDFQDDTGLVSASVGVIPEPGTALLLGLGLMGLGSQRRR